MPRGLLHVAVLVTAACSGGAARPDAARQDTPRADTDAVAVEDCVRGEPEPALVPAGPAGRRPRFERTSKLDATEEAQLDDTTSVRITHTGCAHYVQRFEITIRGAVRDTADTRHWLEQGARSLEAIPAVENIRSQLTDMAAALRGAVNAPTPYAYGDPIRASELAHVYFSVRRAGPRAVVVEIVFDYVL